MKISQLEFPHGLFLAPMAGVTDVPFRALCKKYGAEGVFTEMVSSRALCYHDKKTAELAVITENERPCFLQIFGSDPACMARLHVWHLRFRRTALISTPAVRHRKLSKAATAAR